MSIDNPMAAGRADFHPALRNAMTVDVEDYFHAEALSRCFPRERWDTLEWRVEANVDRLLGLFDAAGISATFFILGWVAERFPRLIARIADGGHEIASHGYDHRRVDHQRPQEFADDVRRATAILEEAGGRPVFGYRAPTFSISRDKFWAFEVLEEAGYRYSSSVFPIRHDSYGIPDAPRFPFLPPGRRILEIPMTTTARFRTNLPCAGGGYFRLLPYWWSRANIARVNREDGQPSVFYIHPWEIDPAQPRGAEVPQLSRLRHYTNLEKAEARLVRLLADFSWGRMDEIFLDGSYQTPGHKREIQKCPSAR
jgi:polysaccharide deacetylase family protein (PEP-CTERM system associated)